MDRVNKQLWIGDFADAADYTTLKKNGIEAVVNLTNSDYTWPIYPSIKYVLKLGQDDGEPIPMAKIRLYLDHMVKYQKENLKVLVHCGAGVSRAPSFVIAWLLWPHTAEFLATKDLLLRRLQVGELWNEYEDQLRKIRPIINPHFLLKTSIIQYFVQPLDGS